MPRIQIWEDAQQDGSCVSKGSEFQLSEEQKRATESMIILYPLSGEKWLKPNKMGFMSYMNGISEMTLSISKNQAKTE